MCQQDIMDKFFQFAVEIVRLCNQLDQAGSISRVLANQLLRSGTSIGANYEEAQAGQTKLDFIAKVSISQKEARETCYWLRLLSVAHLINPPKSESLLSEAESIKRILSAIVISAKRNCP